jgi:hypothetical protein
MEKQSQGPGKIQANHFKDWANGLPFIFANCPHGT